MVVIARESLNFSDADGSKVEPLIWDHGSKAKVRKVDSRVMVDLAGLPGPPGFLDNAWVSLEHGQVTDADVSSWPLSISLLVKCTSFLSTLRWPEGLNDMGKFGVSYFEMLILSGRWIGHSLPPEETVPKN